MSLFDRFVVLDIELKSGDAVRTDGLRVSFEVFKTITTSNNTAKISVWNLSRATRDAIREKDAFVRVQAGYRQDILQEILFSGNVAYIIHNQDSADIVTEIELQDGLKEIRDTRLVLSFGPNTDFQTILSEIISKLGIDRGFIDSQSGKFLGGYAYSGPARDALDEITQKFGLQWSIQNNELQIVKQNNPIGKEAVLINKDTGMIQSPEKLYFEDSQVGVENEPEWKVISLMNPRLVPGATVRVESSIVNGTFIIDNVRHIGDTRGPDFISEIEVRSA